LRAIQACYARLAPSRPGFLDRPQWWWDRLLIRPWDQLFTYVVERGDGVAAYVVYRHTPSSRGWGYEMQVEDLIACERRHALALWRVLGSSSTQAEEVVWRGPADDPLLLLLGEQDLRTTGGLRWMLRMVDIAAALRARGYPEGLGLSVELEVSDAHCPANHGRWRLEVAGGRAEAATGGDGGVRLGVGPLSSLYSGWCSASELARVGLLGGPGATATALANLDAAFSGPRPWLPEIY
jgi:predicted acetyltransferase